ncbi:MAG TPA: hypothetical protein VFA30_06950 [Gaiellaceae bacterium]|nr:hypothetical protein [Gaiellaceae bacterium]
MATVAKAMWASRLRLGAVVLLALAFAPAARAGGPGLLIGATEDAVRSANMSDAKTQMDLLSLAGFRGVRITQVWAPGETTLSKPDKTILDNVVAAAKLDGVTVVTSILNAGSKTTPLTAEDQADFAAYAASVVSEEPALRTVIIGNEPNINRYWLPQFNADGSDAAAPAYESLLAQTYDAIKQARPGVTVLGGAVSPHGGDVDGIRPTHSPTVFIHDLGQAWHNSGRVQPIMDGFAFHPYEDNSSIAPVSGTHPNSTTIALADYDKLVASLGDAFGTYTMPIWYDEFGVESQIPAAKASFYTGTEPTTTHPVSAATQAEYYEQAIQLAFCQPNVQGLFLFHAVDETALSGWQSGLYYADDTPKASLKPVRTAMEESRRGIVAACPGLQLPVTAKLAQQKTGPITLTCNLDCSYTAQLYRLPGHLLSTRHGTAIGGRAAKLALKVPKAKGTYRVRVSAVAPVNPGPPTTVLRNVHAGL